MLKKLRSDKAAGPDGIPAEIIKAAVEAVPQNMFAMFNSLLKEGAFPVTGKETRLLLISKGINVAIGERKFRLICLLNSLGKLMEYLILD